MVNQDRALSDSDEETQRGRIDETNEQSETTRPLKDERRLSNSPTFIAWRAKVRVKAINRRQARIGHKK